MPLNVNRLFAAYVYRAAHATVATWREVHEGNAPPLVLTSDDRDDEMHVEALTRAFGVALTPDEYGWAWRIYCAHVAELTR